MFGVRSYLVPAYLAFATVSLSPVAVLAQAGGDKTPPKTTTVPGYRFRVLGVFDETTGEPIGDVEVRDLLTGNSSLTTNTGTVSLIFVADGGGMLRLRKIGYGTQTVFVEIDSASKSPVTVLMSHVVQLPTMTTTAAPTDPAYATPGLRGFEQRARSGLGRYMLNESIRKQDYRSLEELLRQLGGMLVLTDPLGAAYAATSSSSAGSSGLAFSSQSPADHCRATVYLDRANLGMPDLRMLPSPDQIAGIEWYPNEAEIPIEYSSSNMDCGVLVLWTRIQ